MNEYRLYKGKPVGIFEITDEMEERVEELDVTPITAQHKTFHGINSSAIRSGSITGWMIRFRSNVKLDNCERYWILLSDRHIEFQLVNEPKQEQDYYVYEVDTTA